MYLYYTGGMFNVNVRLAIDLSLPKLAKRTGDLWHWLEILYYDIQWNPSIVDTMGPPLHIRVIRGVRISEASGIFPVGGAMYTVLLSATKESSSLLYACEKGWPETRTMQTNAIIMSSCWMNQRWWTNLRERQVSVRIIQWIMYRPGTKGTEELVRFME